jgi:hypothetical protein
MIHSYKSDYISYLNFSSINDTSLMGEWKFESVNSTNGTLDTSGHVIDCTVFNFSTSPALTSDGKFGKALSFDGVNDAVSCVGDSRLNIINETTMMAWIYPRSSNDYAGIVGRGTVGWSGYIQYGISPAGESSRFGNRIAVWIDSKNSNSWPSLNSTNTISLNQWTHVAASINNTTVKIYINGVLDSTQTSSLRIPNAAGTFWIGTTQILPLYFNGIIDEVRIYNRTLTDGEIKAIYNNSYINDSYAIELEQKIQDSSMMLAYTKGTCDLIDSKMYLVKNESVPSRSFASYGYEASSQLRYQISAGYSRIDINGTDSFRSGNSKICIEKVGKSSGGYTRINLKRC